MPDCWRESRSALLILIFMSYYLIAISCPGTSSGRVKRSLAIYVDRSSSMILGVGVLWPLSRRCCCNLSTTTPPPTVPRNPLPSTTTATAAEGITPASTPTSPAADSPSDQPPAVPDTTPSETVTVTPAPGSQVRRPRARGRFLLVRGQGGLQKQSQVQRCSCSARYRIRGSSGATSSAGSESGGKRRVVVSEAIAKGVKVEANTTAGTGGSREVRKRKECILFRSRVYCTPG